MSPAPKRRLREQRPPIERAAISSTTGPRGESRSSAWSGPLGEPERPCPVRDDPLDLALERGRVARRRDVNGLLEVRAVERVRLVEQREHLERAAAQEPLERDLRAGHERLDEHLARLLLAARASLRARVPEQPRDAPPRGDEPGGIVRADDAAARREDERLQDARVRRRARSRLGILAEIVQREGRHRQAGVPQRGAHRVLVRRAAGALGAVVRQPESLRRERGDHRGRIARRHDSPDRPLRRGLGDLLRRALRPAVVEGDEIGLRAEGVLDLVAEVAPDDERHAEAPRCGLEVVEPVARGRNEEEELASGGGHRAELCDGEERAATEPRRRPDLIEAVPPD